MSPPGGGDAAQRELERLRGENARLRARLERQLGQLGQHRSLAAELGTTRQLGSILGTSLDHAISLSGADGGGIYLLEHDGGDFVLSCHKGVSARFADAKRTLGREHPMVLALTEGGVTFHNFAEHGHLQDEHDRAEGLTSCVHRSIMHGERCMGILSLCSHRLPRLDVGASGALDLLARQLGAAIVRGEARAEQRLLARVVETSIVGTGLADLTGTATYANPALVRMWGYPSQDAMRGMSVLDWWEEPAAAEDILRRVMREGSVTDELMARRADGTTFPVLGTACLILDEVGNPSHVVGSFVDITDVRRGREAQRLLELAEGINRMLEGALDISDGTELRRHCLRVVIERTGATAASLEESLADQGIRSVSVGDEASTCLEVPLLRGTDAVGRLVVGGSPRGFDERDQGALEALAPVLAALLEHRWNREERERQERRLAEQEDRLRRVQKLEAVGRLAGGVAHDFNNLLAVVTMFGQTLLDQLPAGSAQAEDAAVILETAERGAKLTQQLLAFGRRAVLQPEDCQVGALVCEMASMLRRLVGDEVELVLEAGPDEGWVHVDRGEMGQVLMNLAVNARDAMPEGGRLRISVRQDLPLPDAAASSGLEGGPWVEVRVEDTGIGMGPAQLERVFEPFFTTKEKDRGHGLGLATVYGIIEQSGGKVTVRSTLGEGACFCIYLPQCLAPRSSETPTSQRRPVRGGVETVLLAEDHHEVRLGTLRILRRAGYHVLEAANAGEALLIAEQHVGPIHALVTDVDMPRVSGPRLARRLLLARPRMRVLFITGHAGEALSSDGLRIGDARCLNKPYTARALTDALRALLDG